MGATAGDRQACMHYGRSHIMIHLESVEHIRAGGRGEGDAAGRRLARAMSLKTSLTMDGELRLMGVAAHGRAFQDRLRGEHPGSLKS